MQKIGADAPAILDDLDGVVGIMIKVAAAQQIAILCVCPPDKQRLSVNQPAFQINPHPVTIKLLRIGVEAAVYGLVMHLGTVGVATKLDRLALFDIPVAYFRN